MNDIVKLLIEHILSWPVAAVLIGLILKSPITKLLNEIAALINRSNHLSFKHKDISVEAKTEAALQAKNGATEARDFEIGAGTALSASRAAIAVDLEIERKSILDYGKGVLSVQVREESIKAELQRLDFPFDNPDTVDVLVRQLAALQCIGFFERTYRLLYGSQIEMMDFLNTNGPLSIEMVQLLFFDTAKERETEFYSNVTFEQWVKFLLDNLLTAVDEDQIGISAGGRDFLVWIVSSGLSRTRPH